MTQPNQTGFQGVPEFEPDEKEHRRKIAKAVNGALRGKINVSLDVTLRANQTTTIIKDERIGYNSIICPAMAKTANGATAIAAGIYIDTVTGPVGNNPPSATVHHASAVAVDQTIRFLIIN